MAHINFLEPPKFSLSQFNLKQFELNYFWLMTIAGILLVFIFTYGVVQRTRVAALNEALTAAVDAAQKSKTGKPSAGQGATPILAALQNRVPWAPVINAIANQTPATIALHHIKGVAASRALDLEGFCADVAAAARYESDLATIPLFAKIVLQSTVLQEAVSGKPAEKAAGKDKPVAAAAPGKDRLQFNIKGWLK